MSARLHHSRIERSGRASRIWRTANAVDLPRASATSTTRRVQFGRLCRLGDLLHPMAPTMGNLKMIFAVDPRSRLTISALEQHIAHWKPRAINSVATYPHRTRKSEDVAGKRSSPGGNGAGPIAACFQMVSFQSVSKLIACKGFRACSPGTSYPTPRRVSPAVVGLACCNNFLAEIALYSTLSAALA